MKFQSIVILLTVLCAASVQAQERTRYPTLDQPTHFAESYYPDIRTREDQTQAAYLLVLLNLVDPVEGVDPDEMAPPEDLEAIGLSTTLYKLRGMPIRKLPYAEVLSAFNIDPGARSTPQPLSDELLRAQRERARRISAQPDPRAVAELAVISFQHPDPLVRLTAAPLLIELTDAGDIALAELRAQTRSDDSRLALLALTLLARYAPDDAALQAHARGAAPDPGEEEKPQTTLVIHGTFANGKSWWRDGSDFFEHLQHTVPIGDLFLGDDPYAWSGAWRHEARVDAAAELITWASDHSETCMDIIAHSHGANAAFLAAPQLDYGRLVVLSTPSHKHRYPADPDSPILSVRVRMDLVVFADGGGNRFPDQANIEEEYIGWFNHSATHDEDRWADKGVPAMMPGGQCP